MTSTAQIIKNVAPVLSADHFELFTCNSITGIHNSCQISNSFKTDLSQDEPQNNQMSLCRAQ